LQVSTGTPMPSSSMARWTPSRGRSKNRVSLALANTFARAGYFTGTLYYTLGCNTAFRKDAFIRAGMYRCIDAGDDLEIARRMTRYGRVVFESACGLGFPCAGTRSSGH